MRQPDLIPKEIRQAEFSPCRQYRYTLKIVWHPENPRLVQWIGLNPSTADEFQDDPTVRRCKEFARRWGYGGIVMTNLFAWRDTDPEKMKAVPNPVGPDNDRWLWEWSGKVDLVVAAWGNDGAHMNRAAAVRHLIPGLKCLKMTAEGEPWHPLYLPYDLELRDL